MKKTNKSINEREKRKPSNHKYTVFRESVGRGTKAEHSSKIEGMAAENSPIC